MSFCSSVSFSKIGGWGAVCGLRRGHSRFSFALVRTRCSRSARVIRSAKGSVGSLRGDVATRFQQHTPRAAHHRKSVLRHPTHRHGALTKEQLRGNHGSFRLAMHLGHRSTHQRGFLQSPLVGPEKSLVFPSPAIASGRRFQRQLQWVFHVRKQPHIGLVAGTVNPQQAPRSGGLPSFC